MSGSNFLIADHLFTVLLAIAVSTRFLSYRSRWAWRRYTPRMDIAKMLAELREERQQVEEAILTLERVARGRGRRRLQMYRKRAEPGVGKM
jgi:hypothetical protein